MISSGREPDKPQSLGARPRLRRFALQAHQDVWLPGPRLHLPYASFLSPLPRLQTPHPDPYTPAMWDVAHFLQQISWKTFRNPIFCAWNLRNLPLTWRAHLSALSPLSALPPEPTLDWPLSRAPLLCIPLLLNSLGRGSHHAAFQLYLLVYLLPSDGVLKPHRRIPTYVCYAGELTNSRTNTSFTASREGSGILFFRPCHG